MLVRHVFELSFGSPQARIRELNCDDYDLYRSRVLKAIEFITSDISVFYSHNKTLTRQTSSQRKIRRLSGKLHCLKFVFSAENETLGPVCLGCEASSSSVSLTMLKVPTNFLKFSEMAPSEESPKLNVKGRQRLNKFFLKELPYFSLVGSLISADVQNKIYRNYLVCII